MWGMYMNSLKKYKNFKEKFYKYFALTVMLAFSIWFIGGNIYNYFEKKQIQSNIHNLQHEIYNIEVIKYFNVNRISMTNRKAIIAKSVYAILEPKNYDLSPNYIKGLFIQYFTTHGWKIDENRDKPLEHIKVENQQYIIILERISLKNNNWRIVIGNNTFFEKYNL